MVDTFIDLKIDQMTVMKDFVAYEIISWVMLLFSAIFSITYGIVVAMANFLEGPSYPSYLPNLFFFVVPAIFVFAIMLRVFVKISVKTLRKSLLLESLLAPMFWLVSNITLFNLELYRTYLSQGIGVEYLYAIPNILIIAIAISAIMIFDIIRTYKDIRQHRVID